MTETISIVADLALTLSLIVAVIFGIAQVKTAERDRKERLTLETLRNFQTREFASLLHFINSHNMPSTEKELKALPTNDYVMFIEFGQQMESLGILVAEKLINLDLVDKTLGSFVVTSWEKYKKVFSDVREKQSDPFLGEYFEWLAKSIDERMKNSPRKPFYQVGQ